MYICFPATSHTRYMYREPSDAKLMCVWRHFFHSERCESSGKVFQHQVSLPWDVKHTAFRVHSQERSVSFAKTHLSTHRRGKSALQRCFYLMYGLHVVTSVTSPSIMTPGLWNIVVQSLWHMTSHFYWRIVFYEASRVHNTWSASAGMW